MTDVYGTKVRLETVSEDDEARWTSQPLWRVFLRDAVVGYVQRGPLGWYETYPTGETRDAGWPLATRTDALNKLITMAEYEARQALAAPCPPPPGTTSPACCFA